MTVPSGNPSESRSTGSRLTIAWERAEDAADLPRDSGLVFPAPRMTIAWKPMLNSTVLDWDTAEASPPPHPHD